MNCMFPVHIVVFFFFCEEWSCVRVYFYSVSFRFPHFPLDGFCYLLTVGWSNHICGWWLLVFSSLLLCPCLFLTWCFPFIYGPFELMCASCLCFSHFSSSLMIVSVLKPKEDVGVCASFIWPPLTFPSILVQRVCWYSSWPTERHTQQIPFSV